MRKISTAATGGIENFIGLLMEGLGLQHPFSEEEGCQNLCLGRS